MREEGCWNLFRVVRRSLSCVKDLAEGKIKLTACQIRGDKERKLRNNGGKWEKGISGDQDREKDKEGKIGGEKEI
jgi:hypothetical protein